MPKQTPADEPTAAELAKLKRDELDKVAAEAGVPNPDELPNKEAVVEAIEAPNPALAPVADEAEEVERTYRVNGVQPVLGHEPGAQFTAVIPSEQESLLLGAGHIIRIDPED